MVEPIKPIEGMLRDGEGQASVMAGVVRENYWKQKAQEVPEVESGEEAGKADQQEKASPKDQAPTMRTSHTYAEFEINKDTREVIVRIIDGETGNLVRTIPPDELAKELIRGKLLPNQLRRRAILI
jgi:uncharacterized FlaG/YvyC family protein